MKRCYTKVVGDLFHYGHVNFFKNIKEIVDFLVVQVVEDYRVELYKRKPILTQEERIKVIESCKYVDQVEATGPKEITLDFLKKNSFEYYAFSFNSEVERLEKRKDCFSIPDEMILELPYTVVSSPFLVRFKSRQSFSLRSSLYFGRF